MVLANVILSRRSEKKISDRWAPGSSFEKFSDRGLSVYFPTQEIHSVRMPKYMLCFVSPNVRIYIPVYTCTFLISMHVITFLNKDKLFRVLGVSPSFCANVIKLALNRYI